MGKTLVATQSNYIPWKGYFDQIHRADELILLDDVQYTRRDWRNRNRIKTRDGVRWLTIPVDTAGKYLAPIKDVRVADASWAMDHWRTLTHAYGKAPHFERVAERLGPLYEGTLPEHLSDINLHFIQAVCELLDIPTRISQSMQYQTVPGKNERLLSLCQQVGATRYLSGPAAQGYLDVAAFEAQGIEVVWMDYSGYPEYPQLYPPFEHGVSIVDLLVMTGADAPRYMNRSA